MTVRNAMETTSVRTIHDAFARLGDTYASGRGTENTAAAAIASSMPSMTTCRGVSAGTSRRMCVAYVHSTN